MARHRREIDPRKLAGTPWEGDPRIIVQDQGTGGEVRVKPRALRARLKISPAATEREIRNTKQFAAMRLSYEVGKAGFRQQDGVLTHRTWFEGSTRWVEWTWTVRVTPEEIHAARESAGAHVAPGDGLRGEVGGPP